MIEYLKTHWWILAGGFVALWILLKLIGSKSSAGANVSTPTGTSVVYGGTNANDAAVQVAQLQSQSGLAQQQIAGNLAVQQAQIALTATQDTNATNVKLAHVNGAYALATTKSNNAAAVQMNTNNMNLGIVQSNNAVQLGTVQANDAAAVAIQQTNNALALGENTNAANLEALKNTNASKLAAYGIQAQVVNNQTNALATVAVAQTQAQASVQQTYLNDVTSLQKQQQQTQQQEYNTLISSPSFDLKSQHGGANSAAALSSVLNPNSSATAVLGAAAADSKIDQPSNIAALFGSILNGGSNVLGALFA